MKRLTILAILTSLIFMLTACEKPIVPEPQTNRQKIAYAYSAVTSVVEMTTTLVKQNKIPKDVAKQILTQAEVARVMLEKAEKLDKLGQPIDKTLEIVDGLIQAIKIELKQYQ